jgi:hypothetical protein
VRRLLTPSRGGTPGDGAASTRDLDYLSGRPVRLEGLQERCLLLSREGKATAVPRRLGDGSSRSLRREEAPKCLSSFDLR